MITCKKCGGAIKWVQKDRWYCYNLDGTDHWDLCSKRRFEQVKAKGKFFAGKDLTAAIAGYRYKDKVGEDKEMLTLIHAKAQTGSKALLEALNGCAQCVPPWEDCPKKGGCPAQL